MSYTPFSFWNGTNTGSFYPSGSYEVEYLIVAGGGASATNGAGGGGAAVQTAASACVAPKTAPAAGGAPASSCAWRLLSAQRCTRRAAFGSLQS